ncbi:MAG TPA: hypothetical protein VM677_18565 [Actinokineospora sp.]|jgi:hypothetical protein|nr:hypothetical protein [Actinokineospora sp.]
MAVSVFEIVAVAVVALWFLGRLAMALCDWRKFSLDTRVADGVEP